MHVCMMNLVKTQKASFSGHEIPNAMKMRNILAVYHSGLAVLWTNFHPGTEGCTMLCVIKSWSLQLIPLHAR